MEDRGLFSKKNLKVMRGPDKENNGEFIVGMKLGVFKDRHQEFYDFSRYTKISDDLAVYETTHEGDREKAIAEDAVRDGYFGVVTNIGDMKADEIVTNYKTLWIVEDAFGEIKGTLKARPIFHWPTSARP